MRTPSSFGVGLAALALAVPVCAQTFQSPGARILAPQDPSDDEIITQSLGFNFTMPDGTVVNSIDIDTNGRVFAGGAGTSSAAPSLAAFLNDPTSIAICWSDLFADFLFFDNPSPNVAVITWIDSTEFGSPDTPFTLQMQLDGSTDTITFRYDSRVLPLGAATTVNDAIVGISEGGGVMSPGTTNLGAGVATSTGGTLVEFFAFALATQLDLQSLELQFAPNGSGGYVLTALPIVADPDYVVGDTENIFDAGTAARSGCIGGKAFTFLPDGGGGYIITPGGTFDDTFSTTGSAIPFTALTVDPPVQTVAIPFSFTWPSGNSATSIDVDMNGRILEVGSDGIDVTPSIAEFLGNPGASICPYWLRQTTAASASGGGTGGVFGNDVMGTSFSITWAESQEYFVTGGGGVFIPGDLSSTFQLRLFPDSSFQFIYEDVEYLNYFTAGGFPGFSEPGSILVGYTAGNGATNPGEGDFLDDVTAMGAVVAGGTYFEFYDNATALVGGPFEGFDLDDQPNESATLVEVDPPVIGGTLAVDVVDGGGGAVAAAYFFGFPAGLIAPPVDLALLNAGLAGCRLLTDIITPGAVISGPAGTPGTPTPLFAIPNNPVFVGVTGLSISALVVDPSQPIILFPTDELVVTVGI
jgi:hypothetical protein